MTAGRGRLLLIASALAATVAAGGCGASRVLDVGYQARPPAGAPADPRRVVIRPAADGRADRSRIGSALDRSHDLVTRRPVADIVRDALVVEVTMAGHLIVTDRPDVVLAAEVEEFWLDVVRGYKNSQYVGRIVVTLAVVDGRSGERIAARRYVGIKRLETADDPQNAGRVVMDTALSRVMHDLATDPPVVSALAAR
jgi:hypothetical protein